LVPFLVKRHSRVIFWEESSSWLLWVAPRTNLTLIDCTEREENVAQHIFHSYSHPLTLSLSHSPLFVWLLIDVFCCRNILGIA
jgi:hypothetical protein